MSSAVVNTSVRLVGIVVFRSMILVNTPPLVSMPRLSGVTCTHGMTDALRDAELLADAVLALLSGSEEASVMAEYEHTRDRLSQEMFDVTEEIAAYDWELDRLRHLLREVSSAMSDEVDHLQSLSQRRMTAGAE